MGNTKFKTATVKLQMREGIEEKEGYLATTNSGIKIFLDKRYGSWHPSDFLSGLSVAPLGIPGYKTRKHAIENTERVIKNTLDRSGKTIEEFRKEGIARYGRLSNLN